MNTRRFLYLSLILAICLLSGCADRGTLEEVSVYGWLKSTGEWPGRAVFIYAAPFNGDAETGGYYVLEPDLHPHAEIHKNGYFILQDLPQGAYMLLAGPHPEEALRLVDSQGNLLIVEYIGTGVDLGDVYVIE